MKKNIIYLIVFLLMGAGAWYALVYKKKHSAGSQISADMDFAVKDRNDIYKIFLADRLGNTALLERKGEKWVYNSQFPARQTAIDVLLETMEKLRVKYIPPEAAEQNMIKSIASEGIKVEIYGKDGKKMKVYYVGGVTHDESATYMMMEGAEHPYVTHIPTMVGGVRVHYRLTPDEWYDRTIFEEKPESIAAISVQYPQNKAESFVLEKKGTLEYEVRPYFSTTPASRYPPAKGVAEGYLLTFERLVAESHESNYAYKDSLTALVPFAIVNMKKTDGTEKEVKFWPFEQMQVPSTGKIFTNRYLAECSWGPFVLVQERVFGKVFRGYSHFFAGPRK